MTSARANDWHWEISMEPPPRRAPCPAEAEKVSSRSTSTTAPATISPSSAAATHCNRAASPSWVGVCPPSSPRTPAPGVASASSRRMSRSASRSVLVTTSVGVDFSAGPRALRGWPLTGAAGAPAADAATVSSSRGSWVADAVASRSGTPDLDVVLGQHGEGVVVGPGVGHQDVDVVEGRVAEHLIVAELGLVHHRDNSARALDHRSLQQALVAVRRGETSRERQAVAADEQHVDTQRPNRRRRRGVDHGERVGPDTAPEHGELGDAATDKRRGGDQRVGHDVNPAIHREDLGESLAGRARVDDYRAVLGNVVDGFPPDAQLLLGVLHVARVDHWFMVEALEGHRAAVHPAEQLTLLHVRQVAANRLGGDVEAARQVRDVDRAAPQGENVDLSLAVVLELGATAAAEVSPAGAVGCRHRCWTVPARDRERTVTPPSRRAGPRRRDAARRSRMRRGTGRCRAALSRTPPRSPGSVSARPWPDGRADAPRRRWHRKLAGRAELWPGTGPNRPRPGQRGQWVRRARAGT